jgi:hypothetical protein
VDAQAGLDPCWSQTHYVGFVMTRLICFFRHQEIIYAENTVRTVTLYWMLLTMFITFITLIKCGQSRKRIYHEKIRKKQEKIFHDREERFEKQLAESKN